MEITIKSDKKITAAQLKAVIQASGLVRRLETERLEKMLQNADFLITAWEGKKLVGFARGLTDFADVAYLADLAVSEAYWDRGIGRRLIAGAEQTVGADVNIVLLASEKAQDYYRKVGYAPHPRGYIKLAN